MAGWTKRRFALLMVVVLGALVGCRGGSPTGGDGQGGGDGHGRPLTRAASISVVDDLCRERVERVNELGLPDDPDAFVESIGKTIEIADEIRAKIAALIPPAEATEIHADLLEAIDTSSSRAREAKAALDAGDPVAAQIKLMEADQAATSVDDAAKAFGFEVCGSES